MPSKENNKIAISAIFSPILTCFTPQKRVFRQKTHLRGPGGPISSQKIEIITNNQPEQICSIPFWQLQNQSLCTVSENEYGIHGQFIV